MKRLYDDSTIQSATDSSEARKSLQVPREDATQPSQLRAERSLRFSGGERAENAYTLVIGARREIKKDFFFREDRFRGATVAVAPGRAGPGPGS